MKGLSEPSLARNLLENLHGVDVAVYQAVANTSAPALDRAMARLSNAANHSKLWLVTAVGRAWRQALELTVDVPDDGEVRSLAYPALVGTPEVGDDVLLNTTAWAQNLGTGGFATLREVIDFYDRGGGDGGFAGTKDPRMVPIGLSDADKDDLVAFLETLTGDPIDPARLQGTHAQ